MRKLFCTFLFLVPLLALAASIKENFTTTNTPTITTNIIKSLATNVVSQNATSPFPLTADANFGGFSGTNIDGLFLGIAPESADYILDGTRNFETSGDTFSNLKGRLTRNSGAYAYYDLICMIQGADFVDQKVSFDLYTQDSTGAKFSEIYSEASGQNLATRWWWTNGVDGSAVDALSAVEPTATDGSPTAYFGSSIPHSSGDLFQIKNDGTNKFTVGWGGYVTATGMTNLGGYLVVSNTTSASPSGMTGVQIYGGSNGVAGSINITTNGVNGVTMNSAGAATFLGVVTANSSGGFKSGNTTLNSVGLSFNNNPVTIGNIGAFDLQLYVNNSSLREWDILGASGNLVGRGSVSLIVPNTGTVTNGIATFYRNTPTIITVAGSPVNWTNTTAVNVAVYVDGVSVTGTVGINGTIIFNTIGQCTVSDIEPGDWVTIAYSLGTPTAWYR